MWSDWSQVRSLSATHRQIQGLEIELASMTKPNLVIIGGIPGSGKTTLGKKLSEHLRIPFINKDGIIEILFEEIGVKEEEKNIPQLRKATYRTLCYLAEQLGKSDTSVILEGNFNSEGGVPELKKLVDKNLFDVVAIQCKCKEDTAFERFKKRLYTDERHDLHPRRDTFEEFSKRFLSRRSYSLSNLGQEISFEASDFSKIDYKSLFLRISQLTGK